MVDHSYVLVPFWVGIGSAPEPEELVEAFYATLVELLYGISTPTMLAGPPPTVVPAEGSESSGRVLGELLQVLHKCPACDYLVLDRLTEDSRHGSDQTADLRGAVDFAVAQAIAAFTALNPDRKLLLLVEHLPPTADAFWETLEETIARGSLTIVDAAGESRPDHGRPAVTSAVRARMSEMRGSPIHRFRDRLARRWGWYPRGQPDQTTKYVRFYYDAAPAEADLAELIAQTLSGQPLDGIIYHWQDSRWAMEAAMTAAASLGIGISSVAEVLEGSVPWLKGDENRVALVVPTVDSGRTLANVLGSLGPVTDVVIDQIVAPLFADTCFSSPSGDIWDCHTTVDGRKFEFIGYAPISQIEVPLDDPFLTIALDTGAARRPREQDDRGSLSPLEYWSLIDSVGLAPENDVPDHREGEPLVPKTAGILDDYGPWFAGRLWNVIEEETRSLPTDTVFVCPGGEKDSALLADLLRRTVGVRVIEVPRRDLNELARGRPTVGTPGWLTALGSASAARAIVLLDDFTRSGATLDHLALAAKAAGVEKVPRRACLFDFRSHEMRLAQPVLALYAGPLKIELGTL